MAASPSREEYAAATSAAYTLSQSSTFVPPSGWTVVAQSETLSDAFAAVAMKDPSGNIIIANSGSLPGLFSTFGRASLSADSMLANAQSPQALADAQAFAQQVQSQTGSTAIYVTGHSLGGTEAEAECQVLGANCAGGATFGATGLPGNTQAGGPSTLQNYVVYGDPIGSLASDADSPLGSISGGSMYHYGSVVWTGTPSDAAILQSAASHFNDGTVGDTLVGTAELGLAVGNHARTTYATDLDVPSLNPPSPDTDENSAEAEDIIMRIYDYPLGSAGVANTDAATLSSNGTLTSPNVDVSYNNTTNQITIDQLNSVVGAAGETFAAGVSQIADDLANSTSVIASGASASAATISLNTNTFEVGATNDSLTVVGDNATATVTGGGNATTLQDQGQTVTQNGGSITLGSNGTNEVIDGGGVTVNAQTSRNVSLDGTGFIVDATNGVMVLAGNNSSESVSGAGNATTLQDQGQTVTQSGGSITLGSNGTNEVIDGSGVTINGQNGRAFSVDGTGFTVDSTNAAFTISGNNSSASVSGVGNATTLQDQGELVTQSGGTVTLGSNGTNDAIDGSNLTVNGENGRTFGVDGTGFTVDSTNAAFTISGNNSSATLVGAGNATTLQDQAESVTESNGSITLGSNGTLESIDGSQDNINGENGRTFSVDGTNLTVDATNSALTVNGRGTTAAVDGVGNQVDVTGYFSALDLSGVGGDTDVVTASNTTIDLTANESVRITGSDDKVVGNTGDVINMSGIDDNVYADSSTVNFSGTDTGDDVHGESDTGSDWGGYVNNTGVDGGGGGYILYGDPGDGGDGGDAVARPASAKGSVPLAHEDIAAIAAAVPGTSAAGSSLLDAADWDQRTIAARRKDAMGSWASEVSPQSAGVNAIVSGLSHATAFSPASAGAPVMSAGIGTQVQQLVQAMANFSAAPSVGVAGEADASHGGEMARLAVPRWVNRDQGAMRAHV